ncbi:MAG: Xaa-Pro peptidase family protein [Anaerolineales bacterium]|jgi:Xaa-Pro aminopeptidase
MLTLDGCLGRQHRFRERLNALSIEAAIITDLRDIYYLSGTFLIGHREMEYALLPALLLIETDGKTHLVAHTEEGVRGVDTCVIYPWHTFGTIHPDVDRQLCNTVVRRFWDHQPVNRLGWQQRNMPKALGDCVAEVICPDEWITIDGLLAEMQRRKDSDEVDTIRQCIQINSAGYDAAQGAIKPGTNELEVLGASQYGAMLAAGGRIKHLGDYRSGTEHGPARDRYIRNGELYIIDAQTYYHGYWSDMSRTYVVGDDLTDTQLSLFNHISAVHDRVPALLKPGVDGKEVWHALDAMIREHPVLAHRGLIHHGGHGIGLRVHEMPDITPERGGAIETGNVLAVEPGGYTKRARLGVRIENMYLVTEQGAENLSTYPVDLHPQLMS